MLYGKEYRFIFDLIMKNITNCNSIMKMKNHLKINLLLCILVAFFVSCDQKKEEDNVIPLYYDPIEGEVTHPSFGIVKDGNMVDYTFEDFEIEGEKYRTFKDRKGERTISIVKM